MALRNDSGEFLSGHIEKSARKKTEKSSDLALGSIGDHLTSPEKLAEAIKTELEETTRKDERPSKDSVQEMKTAIENAETKAGERMNKEEKADLDKLIIKEAKAWQDLRSVTDEEINAWAETFPTGKTVADDGSIDVEFPIDEMQEEQRPEPAMDPQQLDKEIAEEVVVGMLKKDPEVSAAFGGAEAMVATAVALIAAEKLTGMGLMRRLEEKIREAKTKAATPEKDGPKAKAATTAKTDTEKDATKERAWRTAGASPAKEKRASFSERLSKWYDDTFLKPGALTKFWKKFTELFK
jgi:hypothetical protein